MESRKESKKNIYVKVGCFVLRMLPSNLKKVKHFLPFSKRKGDSCTGDVYSSFLIVIFLKSSFATNYNESSSFVKLNNIYCK